MLQCCHLSGNMLPHFVLPIRSIHTPLCCFWIFHTSYTEYFLSAHMALTCAHTTRSTPWCTRLWSSLGPHTRVHSLQFDFCRIMFSFLLACVLSIRLPGTAVEACGARLRASYTDLLKVSPICSTHLLDLFFDVSVWPICST
jgi:hypothetical protein